MRQTSVPLPGFRVSGLGLIIGGPECLLFEGCKPFTQLWGSRGAEKSMVLGGSGKLSK